MIRTNLILLLLLELALGDPRLLLLLLELGVLPMESFYLRLVLLKYKCIFFRVENAVTVRSSS